MINKVILQGRLVRDPELRHTQSNTPVTSFSVAVDRSFRKEGSQEADFISCVSWGKAAEFVSRYFEKGQAIVLSGRLQSRGWTDKDGNKRTSIEVVTDEISFGESKKDRHNSRPEQDVNMRHDSYDLPNLDFTELDEDDGEVPF